MDEGILPQLECFLYGQNCTLRRCHCGFIRGMSTVRGGDGSFWTIGAVNLLLLLEILSGLQHLVGRTEIAPIIFVSPKGENFFFAASQTQVAVDARPEEAPLAE